MEAARRAQVPDLGALRPVSWSAGDSEAQALFLKIAGPFGQLGFALLEKHQKEWKAKPLKLVPCASSYALLCLCLANLLNLCRFGRLLQLMFVNMHLLCSVDVVCLPIMAGLFFQPEVEISRVPRPRSLGFRLRKTVLLLLYIYIYISFVEAPNSSSGIIRSGTFHVQAESHIYMFGLFSERVASQRVVCHANNMNLTMKD